MNEELKQHLIKAITANVRQDGRKRDEFRPIKIETNISSTAEGSVKITAGETEILAGVKMALGTPFPDTPEDGVLMVNAELTPLSNPEFEAGPPGIDAIEVARVIDRGIRESKTINTKALCVEKGEKVWMVQVDIISLNFDGNLIDLGGLAAIAALMNARFPAVDEEGKVDYHNKTDKKLELQKLPIPITIGKIGGQLIVDPTQTEEEALDARLTITVTEDNNLCAMQKGGDAPLTEEEIKQMVDLAIQKSQELRKILLEACKK